MQVGSGEACAGRARRPAPSGRARKKALFLIDTRGWAFDNIVDQIGPGLAAEHDVGRLYVTDFPDVARLLREILYVERPDLLHIMWHPILLDLVDRTVLRRCASQAGVAVETILDDLGAVAISTTIYDHGPLRAGERDLQRAAFGIYDGYATASPILDGLLRGLDGFPAPLGFLPDGIDLSFYRPHDLERLLQTGRPFRIGWVGNSQWGVLEGTPDLKGLQGIIRPAIAALQQSGVAAEGCFIDRAERWRSREEVARAYHTFDVYVCASLNEGTPNPVLEAMASGVPVVSTDVGIVRYVMGEAQRAFIVERSPEAVATALRTVLLTPGLRRTLSEENQRQIGAHSWAERRERWRSFVAAALAAAGARDRATKRAAIAALANRRHRTMKQSVRSFLRRNPALYSASAYLVHRVLKLGRLGRSRMTKP